MCDYSLLSVKSRPAAVGDKLVTRNFGTGTTGFTDPSAPADERVAVCVLPGTEIAFDEPVAFTNHTNHTETFFQSATFKQTQHKLARFRQINKDVKKRHHDAVEFPDGEVVLLSHLLENQRATVLQLPAQPKNEAEAIEQTRVEYAGLSLPAYAGGGPALGLTSPVFI